MRFVVYGAALAIGLAFGLPASAETISEMAGGLSDKELRGAVQRFEKQFSSDNYRNVCVGAPYYEEFARRFPEPLVRAVAPWLTGICDRSEGRDAQALRNFVRAESVADAGDIYTFIDSEALGAAYVAKDWNAFADHAVHTALRNDPEEFARLNEDLMRYGLQNVERDNAERVAVAFAAMGNFNRLPEDLQYLFADSAVRPSLVAGDTELALQMAERTKYAPAFVQQLVSRQYEAIWPQLE